MKTTFNKIAAVLSFIIGAMAVFAGGQVLLGKLPDYYVINWLLLYNYTVGIITVFLTSALIWSSKRLALPAALSTFSAHALVMVVIQTAYREVVAVDSVRAMIIRLAVWVVILSLMFFQQRQQKNASV